MSSASSPLLGGELRLEQQRVAAQHAVHRRPDLVAHRRQEGALGGARVLGDARPARWRDPAPAPARSFERPERRCGGDAADGGKLEVRPRLLAQGPQGERESPPRHPGLRRARTGRRSPAARPLPWTGTSTALSRLASRRRRGPRRALRRERVQPRDTPVRFEPRREVLGHVRGLRDRSRRRSPAGPASESTQVASGSSCPVSVTCQAMPATAAAMPAPMRSSAAAVSDSEVAVDSSRPPSINAWQSGRARGRLGRRPRRSRVRLQTGTGRPHGGRPAWAHGAGTGDRLDGEHVTSLGEGARILGGAQRPRRGPKVPVCLTCAGGFTARRYARAIGTGGAR